MVVCDCIPSIEEAEAEGSQFEGNPGYLTRPSSKNKSTQRNEGQIMTFLEIFKKSKGFVTPSLPFRRFWQECWVFGWNERILDNNSDEVILDIVDKHDMIRYVTLLCFLYALKNSLTLVCNSTVCFLYSLKTTAFKDFSSYVGHTVFTSLYSAKLRLCLPYFPPYFPHGSAHGHFLEEATC